jgi:hypothetical protein
VTDYSQYTDEELMAIANSGGQDFSAYSDAELMAIAGQESQPVTGAQQEKGFLANQLENLQAAQAGAADMATFGFWDEAKAGIQGAVRPDLGYDYFLDKQRQNAEQLQENNPYAYGSGQLGGAVATGIAAAPLAGIRGINAAVQARPYLSAAGIGVVSGGLYGAGTGEGGAKERAESALYYGAGGGVGGVGGAFLGRNVVGPLTKKILDKIQKKKTPIPSAAISETVAPISEKPISEIPSVPTRETRLLKGAETQNLDLMRQEEMARQGLLGSEMQASVISADKQFEQGVRGTVQSLAGAGTKETSEETLMQPIKMMQRRFKAEKRMQKSLMDARNNAIAKTQVYKDYTKETLGAALKDLKKSDDFVVALQKQDNKPIAEDFKFMEKFINTKDASGLKMSTLAAWRSGLNGYQAGTQQGVLAGKLKNTYDDWLDNLMSTAIKSGDDEIVDKIFTANKSYAAFKNRYGTNKYSGQKKVIENILTQEQMTPRAMVNTIFGKTVDGNDYTEQYVKRMIEAMPNAAKKDQMKQGFQAGLYQRAFENAYNPVDGSIKMGILKNNLLKMIKSPVYKKYIMSDDHIKITSDLIEDIGKYQASTGRLVTAPSAPMAARIMQSVGAIPLLRNVTPYRGAAEALAEVAKKGAIAKDKRAVEKSLGDFYKYLSSAVDPQIALTIGGSVAGAREGIYLTEEMMDKE